MPTIKEILEKERNRQPGNLQLFLEGKFWRAYEQSAYALAQCYRFKPTKRFIKLVGEEVICVGFPAEQLGKYLCNAVVSSDGRECRAAVQCGHDEQAFQEWKTGTRVKEPKPKVASKLEIPEEWKVKTQVFTEENLPVFKMAYGLLLRMLHETQKMSRDFRYTLGEDVKRTLMRVVVCIYHANDDSQPSRKIAHIAEALDKMLEVKLCVRLLHDSKQIALKQYALLCEQMVGVEKHLKDWKHYYSLKLINDEKSNSF